MKKKSFIIHLREARVEKKIVSTSSHPKFVLRLFLKNVMKTNFMEIYAFRGSCRRAIFSYNFTDITKLMILFHLQTLGAGCQDSFFFNF